MKREAKEETNLDVENVKFIKIIENIGSSEFTMKKHFVFINFSARAKNPRKIKLSDELTDYKWFTKSELKTAEMNSSTKETVNEFLKNKKQ